MNDIHLHSYPWYADDWLRSETRMQMTLAERGLYRDVLDYCYMEGSIPDDPELIAKLCYCHQDEVLPLWEKVKAQFKRDPHKHGRLIHARVSLVIKRCKEMKRKNREAGRKGASKKWEQQPSTNQDDKWRSLNARQATAMASAWPTSSTTTTTTTTPTTSSSSVSNETDILTPPEPKPPKRKTRRKGGMSSEQLERWNWFLTRYVRVDCQIPSAKRLFQSEVTDGQIWAFIQDRVEQERRSPREFPLGPHNWLAAAIEVYRAGAPVPREPSMARDDYPEFVPHHD